MGELARYSDLPSFSTDVTQRVMASRRDERVNVPFSDAEAEAEYYLVYPRGNEGKWERLMGTTRL